MAETYRAIREADFDDLSEIAQDWSVVRQLGGWKWPHDPDQIRDRSRPYQGDGFVWAICQNDRLVGTLGVTQGQLGYMLRRDRHGQGIMSRATHRAVGQAFQTYPWDHLYASTWVDNRASHAVLCRLGFGHWQTRYEPALARRLPVLCRHYRLTRTTWEALE